MKGMALEDTAPSKLSTGVEPQKTGFKSGEGKWETKCLSSDFSTKQALICENGSPGRIRTGDLSINSRMLYR